MTMDELIKRVEEDLESEKMRIFAKVEEEIESIKRRMVTKIKSHFKDGNHTSSTQSSLKLEFKNWTARTILTGEEIRGEGGAPFEVALVDDLVGDVVEADEPEASAKIEIVLLKAKPDASDWTAEDFNSSIVSEVEGKKPILAGNVALQLQGGVVAVENIKIRNHASKIKPPEFMLGARVVRGGRRVKEAKTEPFFLKDYRAKYYEKRDTPALSDEVSRLIYIRRGGEIDKRLQESKICSVEDFLVQLLIDPQGLKTIVKYKAKMWEAIVSNARACLSGERAYWYKDPKHGKGVIFNILGHVLGLCSGSCYSRTSTLSEEQKEDAETLLGSAYKNWGKVKAFNDHDSLEQHLAGLSTPMEPGFRGGGASETVGESSIKCSYPSLHSAASSVNLFEETDVGSFTSVGDDVVVDDDDMEVNVMYDAVMNCNRAWPWSPSLVEGFILESNADEPRVVNISNSPRRWKKLWCVSRWFMVRRRVALDLSSPNRKKRRVS